MKTSFTTPSTTRLFGHNNHVPVRGDYEKGYVLNASKRSTAETVASLLLLAVISSAALPSLPHALDVSGISGGATTMASTASGLMARISETGFYQAFSLVFLSEIGDKTFILVIVYGSKFSSFWVWIFSSLPLVLMHILSSAVGAIA